MCGIVGVAGGKLGRLGVNIFEDLMIVSNLRGRWGAGACVVTGEKIMTYKTEWSGVDVIDMKGYRENVGGKEAPSTLLGHTRHPTKGGQTVNESHPHSFKNVTGVHNGTLSRVDGKFVRDDESDSRMFFKHMNDSGAHTAIAYAQGAYCFVWLDHNKRTLNFIRNSQRTMTIAKVNWGTEGQTLVWASELDFIKLIMNRREIRNVEYFDLPINELWSIPIGFKKGDDFTKESSVYGGSGYWPSHTPVKGGKKGKEVPSWGAGFQTSSSSTATSSVGKKTYIFKDGEFVEKDSLLNPPIKQVSLPRPQVKDELEGKEAVRLLDGSNSQGGMADKQRSASPTKISLGSDAASFLRNLTGGVRKEEVEFYSDTVVDLFPKREDGPNYERDNQKIEEEFEKLLATKDRSKAPFAEVDDSEASGVLWEDCQFEDTATRMRETVHGHYIPESDYYKILQNGCVWSGDPAMPDDTVHWLAREEFILDSVTKDVEAMTDLAMVYPHHPQLKGWLAALKPVKTKGKDIAPHYVTVH